MGTLNQMLATLIVLGAIIFLYYYHVHTRTIDDSEREQVRNWPFYFWIDVWLKASTLLITLWSLLSPTAWLLPMHDLLVVRLVGLAVSAGGLGVLVWAMRTLADEFSPAHVARVPRGIVTSGPYRWLRHPIYAANIWLLIGLLLVSGSGWLIANLLLLIGHYIPTMVWGRAGNTSAAARIRSVRNAHWRHLSAVLASRLAVG